MPSLTWFYPGLSRALPISFIDDNDNHGGRESAAFPSCNSDGEVAGADRHFPLELIIIVIISSNSQVG